MSFFNTQVQYKKLLVRHFLRKIKEKVTIVLPDETRGIYFINEAWILASAETIFNCWKHCDIMPENGQSEKNFWLKVISENLLMLKSETQNALAYLVSKDLPKELIMDVDDEREEESSKGALILIDLY